MDKLAKELYEVKNKKETSNEIDKELEAERKGVNSEVDDHQERIVKVFTVYTAQSEKWKS